MYDILCVYLPLNYLYCFIPKFISHPIFLMLSPMDILQIIRSKVIVVCGRLNKIIIRRRRRGTRALNENTLFFSKVDFFLFYKFIGGVHVIVVPSNIHSEKHKRYHQYQGRW
ncbi:uncharacterized protein LOC127132239 [Lathyrus oleraceus]|uniref:uncharacterized protein LOC127132239 n=1 Tax=Pisum sativum TaxID=3888 RepID=UPI0021D3C8F7|nr:uncharacterized protein LOC127132239 [Pisum sativum]